jgi:hypothetical protein
MLLNIRLTDQSQAERILQFNINLGNQDVLIELSRT